MNGLIATANYWLSEKYAKAFLKKPFIQVFLLHKIFLSRAEIIPANGSPSDAFTKDQLRILLEYFLERGYQFISADQINDKLDRDKNYIILTFDDGYFNNFRALELLAEYKAKATFYISTSHIEEGKSFWWDVLYRERMSKSVAYSSLAGEIEMMLQKKWFEQDAYLTSNFGKDALVPRNDIDRPMTPEELIEFANHPQVVLGNHTDRHLNMTLYTEEEILQSLNSAQDFLMKTTGIKTDSVSYPYGIWNQTVVDATRKANYTSAITTIPGKHLHKDFPIDTLKLKRSQLTGEIDVLAQCRNVDVGFSIAAKLKSIVR